MTKKMLIDAAHQEEVRVCVLQDGKVEDFDFESSSRKPLRGNIYLARVTRVEPSLQAAFVEYGGNRHGFLAFNEIHPDYYQIPISDRQAIQQAEAEEAALADELDLAQRGDDDDDSDEGGGEISDDGGEAAADDDADVENGEEPDGDDVSRAADASESGDNSDHDDDDKPAARLDAQTPSISADDDSDDTVGVDEEFAANAAEEDENDDDEIAEDVADGDAGEDDSGEEDAGEDDADEDDTDEDDAGEDDAGENDDVDDDEDQSAEARSADDGEAAADEPAEAGGGDKNRRARAKRAELLERYKEARRKRARLVRSYKIQEVVKRRQILLIQVVKEERGNKGAALTTYLSLAGRYCVLMPNTARGGGISRKIPNSSDRKRLRRVVDGLDVAQGMGLIIRTAGAKRTKAEVKRDYEYLTRLWETIRSLTLKSIAPCLIYEEASLIKRAIRDLYDKDIASVLVEGEAGYREAKDFMKMLMPSHAKNVQPYKEKLPLFIRHDVEGQLDAMYQPVVRLKSGGYLVINQTEALVAIDVNSGKATRERNIELTALKTNLEAAKEAARQFRLRDLAGLIVIDFIDMEENRNNRSVEKKLKEALKHDRARIQVGRISNFGLLEMSRQRRRSGIVDGTTDACPTCAGAGVVRSHEMAALRILRAIESEAIGGRAGTIILKAALDVTLYMLNHKREWMRRIEEDCAVTIEAVADETKAGDQYEIEKRGAPRPRPDQSVHIRADQLDLEEIEPSDGQKSEDDDRAEASGEDGEKTGKRRRRRRRRKKEGASENDQPQDENLDARGNEEDDGAAEGTEQPAIGEDGEERPKRRRRRGRRGGRRNARNAADAENNEQPGTAAPDGAPEQSEQMGVVDDGATESGQPAVERSDVKNQDPESDTGEHALSSAEDAVSPSPLADPAGEPNGATIDEARDSPDSPVGADIPHTPPVSKKSKSSRKGWWQKAIGG